MSAPQSCRVCGCTDTQACLTDEGPCYWAEDDLCSGCAAGDDGSGPAFPFSAVVAGEFVLQTGMSIRQWYAGRAMAALAVKTLLAAQDAGETPQAGASLLAEFSFAIADAMLEAEKRR